MGQSRGGSQTPSLVLPAWGLAQPPAQSIHAPRPRLPVSAAHSGVPDRYPPAPLPPLLGREAGSWRPRILPPGPASCASHPSARDPRREGRRLDGQASSVHLRWGGCLPGRDVSSVNTLLHTLQLRARSLGTGWGREQPEEQQGREGEWCGRLATAARPGKRLCATTRTRTGAGPRPLPTERRVSRKL